MKRQWQNGNLGEKFSRRSYCHEMKGVNVRKDDIVAAPQRCHKSAFVELSRKATEIKWVIKNGEEDKGWER